MRDYNKLKPEANQKMIAAWTPVIALLLDGFSRFDELMV
jgi:brefeldin A-inhibited guanine nucleotide-exchange protein